MDPIIWMTMVWIAIIGLGCYALITFVPMPPQFKQIVVVFAVVATFFWLLDRFGLFHFRG